MRLRIVLYTLIQWVWGLSQNLLGLVLMACLRDVRIERFRGAVVVYYRAQLRSAQPTTAPPRAALKRFRLHVCFALGMFLFLERELRPEDAAKILVHEYGHTIQSLLCGPLYLLMIGLPSLLWSRRFTRGRSSYRARGIAYHSRYPERGANRFGERLTGCDAIDW